MSSTIQQITTEQVRDVLTWPMVCEAVEEAIIAVSAKSKPESDAIKVSQPPRSLTICGDKSKILFSMPGYVGNYQLTTTTTKSDQKKAKLAFNSLGCKLVTSFSQNAQRPKPLPNILANILLFNTETGQLDCVIEATDITGWRTAAASIIATKHLYFPRYAEGTERPIKVAIIGTGMQGASHALGMCATFNVSDIFLWNRTKSKADALEKVLHAKAPNVRVEVCESAAKAVADADVICAGTYSSTALFSYDMIKKEHVHINTVGAGEVHYGEIATDIYEKAKVYVDSWDNAKKELNGLKAEIVCEVGEVINEKTFPLEDKITIFQSMGMAAEDVTVGQAVYYAIRENKGD